MSRFRRPRVRVARPLITVGRSYCRPVFLVAACALLAMEVVASAAPVVRSVRTDNEAAANVRVAAPAPLAPSAKDAEAIRGTSSAPTSGSARVQKAPALELPHVVLALSAVVGLILLLGWGGRKLSRRPGSKIGSRAVQVLGRTPLSPRQQVILLRVGKRVIVVGDSGSQLNTLCEIKDADEVAALVGRLNDDKFQSPAATFGSLFGRARREIEENVSPAAVDDDQEMPDPAQAETAIDPELTDTRDELRGLIERARTMSEHFRGEPRQTAE